MGRIVYLRLIDIVGAAVGLSFASPLLLVSMLLIWRQDGHSPFYVSDRTGIDGKPFRMVKLRSMVVGADSAGVDSTAGNDQRITAVGHFVRRLKLDELPQLWNVLKGDMSLVGPRPNVPRETARYSAEENRLLTIVPGITDLASIVFADEGDILAGKVDPDLAYRQLIWPWKSRLGLLYVNHRSLHLYMSILVYTGLGIFSRSAALAGVGQILRGLCVDPLLIEVSLRERPLDAYASLSDS